jgi:hypothetical protein
VGAWSPHPPTTRDTTRDMALRSRLSAASCFWRGREKEMAQRLPGELLREHPSHAAAIQQVADELARDHPLA